jgi:hypothetical protein
MNEEDLEETKSLEEIKPDRIVDGEEYLRFENAQEYFGMSKSGFQEYAKRVDLAVWSIPEGSRSRYIKKKDLDEVAKPALVSGKERSKSKAQLLEEFVRELIEQSAISNSELQQKAKQLLEEK